MSFFPSRQGFRPSHLPRVPETLVRITVATRTFTDMAAAETEISNADRATIDLSRFSECAMSIRTSTIGVTGQVKLQYSLDGTAWADLTAAIALSQPIGHLVSAWQAIPIAARTGVSVRMVGFNGNTTEDPVVTSGVQLVLR